MAQAYAADDQGGEDDGEANGSDSDAGGAPTMQIDPLELRFSQRKMRNVFADGMLIEDSVQQVRAVRRSAEDAQIYGAQWRLEAPFPPVEVLRFRCKLRDENTGRPLLDKETGQERFESEESWFTLDNRRLYCLQRAAVGLLPERATAAAVAELGKERRLREIRKFRTLDNGKSIEVGSVVDGVPFETWCWAAEAKRQASSGSKARGRGKTNGHASEVVAGADKAGAPQSAGKGGGASNGKAKGSKGKGKDWWKGSWYSGYAGYDDYDYYGWAAPDHALQSGKGGKGKKGQKGKAMQQWWW